MNLGAYPNLTEQIGDALDWWREAGVDSDFSDTPLRWMKEAEPSEVAQPAETSAIPAPAPAVELAPVPPVIDRDTWPSDLEAFAPWWLTEAWLDSGQSSARVAPKGNIGARLMVLVPEPEREDTEQLLSGPHGRLLGGFLAAIGVAPGDAYFASVLPRHTPHADWTLAATRGLGELALHHVALAAPQRLIVFGNSILPLIGHDPALTSAHSGQIQLEGRSIPMLAARDLAMLIERPRWKAGLWQNWLEWTAP